MKWKEIKARIKSVPFIGGTYDLLYGNRKWEKLKEAKRVALQREGYDLAEAIDNELSKYNVTFFLDFGSLLGIVRSGEFISHDLDMDYGIVICNSFTWDDLERALKPIGLKKIRQFRLNGKITEQTYAYQQLTVDFFHHRSEKNYDIAYNFFVEKGKKYKSYEQSVGELKLKKVTGTAKLNANGRTYTIPTEPEKYLESIYTENWRIPDPNWISENGPAWNTREDLIGICESFD